MWAPREVCFTHRSQAVVIASTQAWAGEWEGRVAGVVGGSQVGTSRCAGKGSAACSGGKHAAAQPQPTLASLGEEAAKKWVWLPHATLNTQPAFLGLNCGPERSTWAEIGLSRGGHVLRQAADPHAVCACYRMPQPAHLAVLDERDAQLGAVAPRQRANGDAVQRQEARPLGLGVGRVAQPVHCRP